MLIPLPSGSNEVKRCKVYLEPLCAHDLHRRQPGAYQWAAYARRNVIKNLATDGPPYREIWDIKAALSKVFDSISKTKNSHA